MNIIFLIEEKKVGIFFDFKLDPDSLFPQSKFKDPDPDRRQNI